MVATLSLMDRTSKQQEATLSVEDDVKSKGQIQLKDEGEENRSAPLPPSMTAFISESESRY